MSFLNDNPTLATVENFQKMIDSGQRYFDYLLGHVIKVDLSEDVFDPSLYDRDCGSGMAEKAVQAVRNGEY